MIRNCELTGHDLIDRGFSISGDELVSPDGTRTQYHKVVRVGSKLEVACTLIRKIQEAQEDFSCD